MYTLIQNANFIEISFDFIANGVKYRKVVEQGFPVLFHSFVFSVYLLVIWSAP